MSSVSLRDVKRFQVLLNWFITLLANKRLFEPNSLYKGICKLRDLKPIRDI